MKINNLSKFFLSGALVAALAACSDNEPKMNGGDDNTPDFKGDVAYVKINISDVTSRSRATEDGGFKDGDATEHEVKHAKFLFFLEDGSYSLETNLGNPKFGDDTEGGTDTWTPADGNIEYIGTENILVLEGLTEKGTPRYMLTVLNAPEFKASATLEATAKDLVKYQAKNNADGKNYFVMTTSSYFDGMPHEGETPYNHVDKYPYATRLDNSDFYLSADEAKDDPNVVEVYVERLAAKVEVTLNLVDDKGNTTNQAVELENGLTGYKLHQTVAGDDNGDENDNDATVTDVYLVIEGWALNNTATNSYLSKQIDGEGWNAKTGSVWNNPFKNWNEPGRYRSYWGKSYIYDNANATLNNVTYNDLTLALTNSTEDDAVKTAYCNENTRNNGLTFATNAAGKTSAKLPMLTSVVLSAKVCDITGNGIDMVRYQGILYKTEAYMKNILSNIQYKDGLNYYYFVNETEDADGTKTKNYRQVGAEDLKIDYVDEAKTQLRVVLNNTATLFAKGTDETTGKDKYTKITDGATALAALIKAEQSESAVLEHMGKGTTYYTIPVEHLAATKEVSEKEGFYGVVRNHWYEIEINKFAKIGNGIHDPENGNETIKPNETQDPYYYVGATIKVLNWKVVSQKVEL